VKVCKIEIFKHTNKNVLIVNQVKRIRPYLWHFSKGYYSIQFTSSKEC